MVNLINHIEGQLNFSVKTVKGQHDGNGQVTVVIHPHKEKIRIPIVIPHREEKGFRLQYSLEDSTEKEVTTEVQKRDGQNGKESQKKEEEIQGATKDPKHRTDTTVRTVDLTDLTHHSTEFRHVKKLK